MDTYTYTAHLEPAEEGGYTITVPALPGCVTEGDTYEHALANAHEAILCYLDGLRLDGEPSPQEPNPIERAEVPVNVELSGHA